MKPYLLLYFILFLTLCVKPIRKRQVHVMVQIVSRIFHTLICRVFAVIVDILIEYIVYPQREATLVLAETIIDACVRHQLMSVHL